MREIESYQANWSWTRHTEDWLKSQIEKGQTVISFPCGMSKIGFLAVCQRCGAYFSIDGRGRVPNWCKTCKPIHNNAMNYLRRSGNKESV